MYVLGGHVLKTSVYLLFCRCFKPGEYKRIEKIYKLLLTFEFILHIIVINSKTKV